MVTPHAQLDDSATYRVPQRFGMAPVLITMTLLAILFGFLQAVQAPPWVHITVSLFFFTICGAQMWFKQEPRIVSSAAGAAFLPVWVIITLSVIPQDEVPIVAVIVAAPFIAVFGAGCGYLVGALGAGVFLILDHMAMAHEKRRARRARVDDEEFLMEVPKPKTTDETARTAHNSPANNQPIDAVIVDDPLITRGGTEPPAVRALTEPQVIPVFNCQLLVSQENNGAYRARSVMLDGIDVLESSERAAMQAAVAAFKQIVTDCYARGSNVPWLNPPREQMPGEQERWIAVHL